MRGILVTEGVRGEGGVLRNKEGRRFMFDDIPDLYKTQTADNEDEGWRYTQGDQRCAPAAGAADARSRGPLHQSRSKGRARQPAWRRVSGYRLDQGAAAEAAKSTSRRKLPSMYHQFKQLADIDITKEPMEVGPTTHYMMGGIRVDGDSQMSTVPGLFAAGECGRRSARRQSPGRQFALRSAGIRQARRRIRRGVRQREHSAAAVDEAQIQNERPRPRWRRSIAAQKAKILTRFSTSCRTGCRTLVGIVRVEDEMERGAGRHRETPRASREVGVPGNRQYNSGWHTAMDLDNLLHRFRSHHARRDSRRKESRGAQFRDDFPEKDPEWGKYNIIVRRGAGWRNDSGAKADIRQCPES